MYKELKAVLDLYTSTYTTGAGIEVDEEVIFELITVPLDFELKLGISSFNALLDIKQGARFKLSHEGVLKVFGKPKFKVNTKVNKNNNQLILESEVK